MCAARRFGAATPLALCGAAASRFGYLKAGWTGWTHPTVCLVQLAAREDSAAAVCIVLRSQMTSKLEY
jgi:hypothetical protein